MVVLVESVFVLVVILAMKMRLVVILSDVLMFGEVGEGVFDLQHLQHFKHRVCRSVLCMYICGGDSTHAH